MNPLFFIMNFVVLWFGFGIVSCILGILLIIITGRIAGFLDGYTTAKIYGEEYAEKQQEEYEKLVDSTKDYWPISRWVSGITFSIFHWPTWVMAVMEQARENFRDIRTNFSRLMNAIEKERIEENE